jgi:hypothetical protein
MPDPRLPDPSLATLRAAPTRIATVLKTYSRAAARFADQSALPAGTSRDDRAADQAASQAELAELQQQMLEDLRLLEDSTRLALADAQDSLEAAILPVASTDPQVQRVFELRQAKALARLRPLLERARTEAAIDDTVRRFADEAARQSDWASLRVLRTETAPTLSRHGIDPATSEALRIIEHTVAAVRPRAATALAERQALDRGAARVAIAFARARDAVAQQEQEVQLPGYDADVLESVTLSDPR